MSRSFRFVLCLLCVALLSSVASGGLGSVQVTRAAGLDTTAVDAYMTDLMKLYDIPGASIALVSGNTVVYTKGYGLRDTASKMPVTDQTAFQIGSVTKSFTALEVAQLVDAGKIDLDTPITKYLPDLKLSDADATKQVTVRQVLSMASGLPRADQGWVSGADKTRQQVISDLAQVPLTDKPGKLWQYSNQNFVLAGALVEKISGQTWEEYTHKHIFEPLGMKNAATTIDELKKLPDYAVPHGLTILSGQQPIAFLDTISLVGPAGAISASATDLAQFLRVQLGNGTINGKPIVSPPMLKEMHREHIKLTTGPDAELLPKLTVSTDFGYGLGWFTETYRGNAQNQHDGVVNGFMASVTVVPSKNVGVAVLTNTSGVNFFVEAARLRLVEFLLDLPSTQNIADTLNTRARTESNPIFHFLDPVSRNAEWDKARAYKSDPKELEALAGDYDLPGGKMTAVVRDGRLRLRLSGQEMDLVQAGPNEFLSNTPLSAGARVNFKTDDSGTITVFVEGQQFAQRLGKNVKVVEYKDPKGRFTVTQPDGLTLLQQGDLGIFPSTNPAGALFVGATAATQADLKSNVKTLLGQLSPGFNIDPFNTRDVPVNGQTWTQYLYQLPGGQILAIVAIQQKGTLYVVGVQGVDASVQALTPKLNALLLSFKITG